MKAIILRLLCIPLLLLLPLNSRSQTGQPATAEDVVQDIYRLVSFPPGKLPDWEKVRAHFVPSAQVFLRVSRDSSHIFSVDGFIDDFVKFAEQPRVKGNGFSETVVKGVTTRNGDNRPRPCCRVQRGDPFSTPRSKPP